MSKKNVKRFGLMLTVCFILSALLTGCGGTQTTPVEEKEKVLVIGYDRDAEILDTIKTAWYSDSLIYIHDRLVSRDYEFSYKPGLAEKWETSEDGLTWRFFLIKNAKFHNGDPVTAKDVKWTIDTILNPDTGSPFRGDLSAIEEVNVVDEYTVDIVLKYPFPNLLFNLSNTASGIHPANAYETYGDDYGTKVVIGSGPYKLVEWIQGDKIVLEKNDEYDWNPEWMEHQGAPLIDKIILRTVPDENARMMELEVGGIHLLRTVPTPYIEKFEANEDLTVHREPSTKLGYLAYATDKKPYDNVLVRRAINHAINREEIVEYVLRGIGEPAYGYLPPVLKDEYFEETKDVAYKYDPEKAKELLAEAGYPDGFKATLSADNSTQSSRLAEVYQSQLKEVGIDAEIRLYDSASYVATLREGEQELFVREYSWPNADILDWFLLSDQFPYPNHSRWVDERTDELINGSAQSPTWEARAEGYKELQKYLIEQAVWCPVYIPEQIMVSRKEVLNFKFHPWMLMFQDGFDIAVE